MDSNKETKFSIQYGPKDFGQEVQKQGSWL